MMNEQLFTERLGIIKFMIWSKENELYRTFYRTTVAGHWDKADIAEFHKCGCYYEICFDHSRDDDAQLFAMMVLQRLDNFKAARVSKVAVNNIKVMILLGKSGEDWERIAYLAKHSGFEANRMRSKSDVASDVERYASSKIGQYFESLKNMFAPMAGRRVERRDF